jgi:hypothetical protein
MITVLTFVLILLLGVPFLLYCLYNFVREMAPYKRSVCTSSPIPALHSVEVIRAQRHSRPKSQLTSPTRLRYSDQNYAKPSRAFLKSLL